MRSRVITLLLVVVIGVVAWGVYANVLSDDTALRAQAEKLAREKAGCGAGCKLTRMEGSRGLLNEQVQFTFDKATVLVECKRTYIAFGAYHCR